MSENSAVEILPAVADGTKSEIKSIESTASKALSLKVTTNKEYQQASDILKDLKARGKALEEKRKAITKPMDDAKKATMEMFRPAVDAIKNCETKLKESMAGFVREQERIAAEAQAKAAEKARKEQERLQARADKARESGKEEKAELLEQQACSVVPAVSSSQTPQAKGAHSRKIWKAKLIDKMELIKAVAEGKASPELLDFNESVANGLAKSLKTGLNIPGLESYQDISIASR